MYARPVQKNPKKKIAQTASRSSLTFVLTFAKEKGRRITLAEVRLKNEILIFEDFEKKNTVKTADNA